MWGGLEYFSSTVVDCYYHDVTGFPMFTVNFGGSIGKREMKVSDTIADPAKIFVGTTQPSLDFGSPFTTRYCTPPPTPNRAVGCGHRPSREDSSRGPLRKQ